MIYADLESNLIPEKNGKQNSDESYTNKYQNHVGCSYRYKLTCVDNQLSKSFSSQLVQNATQKFVTSLAKESNIVVAWWKIFLIKNLLRLKKITKILKALQNVGFVIIILPKTMLQ